MSSDRYAWCLQGGALARDGCRLGASVLAILVVEDRAQAERGRRSDRGHPCDHGIWHPGEEQDATKPSRRQPPRIAGQRHQHRGDGDENEQHVAHDRESKVRSRARRRASSVSIGPCSSAVCSRLSIAVLARCHTKSATSPMTATLNAPRTIRVNKVSPVATSTRSKSRAQASASTVPMISKARMPRSRQIAGMLIDPSGRRSGSMRRKDATRVWTGWSTNGSAPATARIQKAAVAVALRR